MWLRHGFGLNNVMRPICTRCNRNPRRVNYIKNGIKHYRSLCWGCTRNVQQKPPSKPLWQLNGYIKKSICDQCGFKCIYPSQMTVYYIDGNLNNTSYSNLRTICLNCVEVVKRININWKRGDLTVDY